MVRKTIRVYKVKAPQGAFFLGHISVEYAGMQDIEKLQKKILTWYSQNGRPLPWRKTRNPYRILVSEVMLQQTQVERVIPKYREFLKQFSTVKKLANAKASDVIKAWKGLGYNRRALFLQRTAKEVVQKCGGRFPKDLDTLKTLPGVGDYTARAILSFAYDQQVPMMDTNHRKFYQRVLFGRTPRTDKQLLRRACEILPKDRAYDWNQALMDLGGYVCTEKRPGCQLDWLQVHCKACAGVGRPVKKQKKKVVKFRDTDRYYRGRIIDALREKESLTSIQARKICADISADRFEKILTKLESDGLIKRIKKRIVLP